MQQPSPAVESSDLPQQLLCHRGTCDSRISSRHFCSSTLQNYKLRYGTRYWTSNGAISCNHVLQELRTVVTFEQPTCLQQPPLAHSSRMQQSLHVLVPFAGVVDSARGAVAITRAASKRQPAVFADQQLLFESRISVAGYPALRANRLFAVKQLIGGMPKEITGGNLVIDGYFSASFLISHQRRQSIPLGS
eukprot:1909971-Pleurochrysis_carterae.AAC.2